MVHIITDFERKGLCTINIISTDRQVSVRWKVVYILNTKSLKYLETVKKHCMKTKLVSKCATSYTTP